LTHGLLQKSGAGVTNSPEKVVQNVKISYTLSEKFRTVAPDEASGGRAAADIEKIVSLEEHNEWLPSAALQRMSAGHISWQSQKRAFDQTEQAVCLSSINWPREI
jgi:hypothetical protein